MDSKPAQHLRPPEMVTLLRTSSREAFVEAVGTALILVRVDDPSGDAALTLEAALEDASASSGRPSEPTMGYDTIIGSVHDRNLGASLLAARAALGSFGPSVLQRLLARAVHFVVPLTKRPGASNVFSERISVGRSRTNDVVLRHHSVSKFHAWFERDEDDRYYLGDAKSTNATTVNGVDIPRSAPVAVDPGDELRFGDVAAVFCTPAILWDTLMGGALPPSSRSGSRLKP
jgi:hypothetical protein